MPKPAINNFRMKKLLIVISCYIAIFLASCEKDKPAIPSDTPPPTPGISGGVFILNEGNFQWGNASLSYFSLKDSTVNPDLFKQANERTVGDVLQSMLIEGGKAYLVVNNSGKIEVMNPADGKSLSTITGFNSPRYMCLFRNKAFVTDFKANAVSVLDLTSSTITKEIPVKGWTEEMAIVNEKLFVTSPESGYLYIIDAEKEHLTDSIKIGYGSNSIRKDKNGKLWVLCGGKSTANIAGSLYRINPHQKKVEASFTFSGPDKSPFKLRINSTEDTLFFLNNGIFRFPINSSALPTQPIVSANAGNFWGLGIQPGTGHVYASDAIDYLQKGQIQIYSSSGTYLHSFSAGIIPGDFYFHK
jgi:hypothetical protein